MKTLNIILCLMAMLLCACWGALDKAQTKRVRDNCEFNCYKKYQYCNAKPHEPGSCSQTYGECMATERCEDKKNEQSTRDATTR
jgi:hypothetical protein